MDSLSPTRSALPYRQEIDGLRAIAVMVVVFSHARLGCPGGFVGVDVFFVISGYLITALILRDLEAGEFRAADFWERRVRRIAPALIVTVTAVFFAGWFLFLPSDYARLGQAIMAQVVCASNVVHWRMSGYFAPDAETLPLLHTWSLAVEEQFYIGLPVALWLLRSWRKSSLRWLLVLAGLVSFGVGVWATKRYPSAAYYLLPSRAWELILGSILATLPVQTGPVNRPLRELASLLGLLAIAVSVTCITAETPFPGVAALLPTLGTVAFLWSNREEMTLGGRILSWRPFVFVGQISYSLYLLHWPLIVFLMYWFRDGSSWPWRLGIVGISLVGATLSWLLIETPVRQKRVLPGRRGVFWASGVSLLLLLALGFRVHQLHGIPSRFDPRLLNYVTHPRQTQFRETQGVHDVVHGNLAPFGVPEGKVNCLVWGDSHALALLPCLDEMYRQHGLRGEAATHSSTAPLLHFISRKRFSLKEESPRFSEAVVTRVNEQGIRQVILAGVWESYAEDPEFESCLNQTVLRLKDAGVQVIIVRDVPVQNGDVPRLLGRALLFGQDVRSIGVSLDQHRRKNRLADQCFEKVAGSQVVVLDPTPYFIDGQGTCRAELDGVSLYRDSNHLSIAGALRLKPLFEQVLINQDASQ